MNSSTRRPIILGLTHKIIARPTNPWDDDEIQCDDCGWRTSMYGLVAQMKTVCWMCIDRDYAQCSVCGMLSRADSSAVFQTGPAGASFKTICARCLLRYFSVVVATTQKALPPGGAP